MTALQNVLVNGIIGEIHDNFKQGRLRAAAILTYCGIDAMAFLTMPKGQANTTRTDFIKWVDDYLVFHDGLKLAGLELYAARCALVHTYSTEAELHRNGKVLRQIAYTDEMLPEIAESDEEPNLVLVSIRGLVDAFHDGVAETIKTWMADREKRELAEVRLREMVHIFSLD